MAYVPYRRASLLIPFHSSPHLFILLNDPCRQGMCLSVMISSIKENKPYDSACVLEPGVHEFITLKSSVVYRQAETPNAKHIGNMVDKRYYVAKADVTDGLFHKVVAGLFSSDNTRPRIIAYATGVGLAA
ncbi:MULTISPECIES: hypothetical protein [Rhodopseudomonas]|uniref:hypothetical protein n=1 Tax=Rhodopseudomonas TaxID=1073 RepID=UPI00128CDA7D|nr:MULTISPECIES: hypothetical protein [Rhodopseudomonas]MDF3813984.1 hypothetical protein [Rhodopseudomonas sp. BAL398]WOK19944.1 hypothetical protein RBJ75_10695 [Rhodopseudomonas sp. BAL398]